MNLRRFLLLGCILALFSHDGKSQCTVNAPTFTSAAQTSTIFDNRAKGCVNWIFTYSSSGFSAISVQVEGAQDNNGTPGAFAAITSAFGSNPSTVPHCGPGTCNAGFLLNPSYIRVNLTAATGTGTVFFQLFGTAGASQASAKSGGGGGGGGGVVTQPWLIGTGGVTAGDLVCASRGTVSPVTAIDCPISVIGLGRQMDVSTIGIAQTTAIAGATANIIVQGPATCNFDSVNAVTSGHTANASLTTAAHCQDSGTESTNFGVPFIGVASASGAAGSTQNIYVYGSGLFGSAITTIAPLGVTNPGLPFPENFQIKIGDVTSEMGTGTILATATGSFTPGDGLTIDATTHSIIDTGSPVAAGTITSVFGVTTPVVGAVGDISATGRIEGINAVPLCAGFTPTNGQNLQYTTASSPNPCYTAATPAGGSAFSAITSGTNTAAAMLVGSGASLAPTGTGSLSANQLNAVPFCTGFTPTNGQNLEYTTASSPNPCYTAISPSGSSAFSAITSGTNTAAAMLVGSGASLAPTGTGSLSANQLNAVPFCAGFTPTTSQFLQYTTASSPNPCYTAAAGSSFGGIYAVATGTATATSNSQTAMAWTTNQSGSNTTMHSTVTNNTRFTAVNTGPHTATCSMGFVSAQTGQFEVALRLNGGPTFYGQNIILQAATAPALVSVVTIVLTAGDYFECMTLSPLANTISTNPLSVMSLIQNF